jgi:hypothetical protein
VAKVNKELRKWVLKLIRFCKSGDKGIEVSEFKMLLENIKQQQGRMDYKYLPENYE